MLESFLVTSRETLEASLVVGIVLAYLNKTNNKDYRKSVYYGIISGIIASLLAAFAFTFFAGDFEGMSEKIFEGFTMLGGAFLLTTMIMWMMRQRHISREIESKVDQHLQLNKRLMSHIGIFMVVFIAIIREGIETVIFLNAVNYASGINFIGGTLGIATAIFIGYLFFVSTKKINLKRLFNVSSFLLVLFAAGLVVHAVREFEEAKLVNGIINPLYDLNPAVNANESFPLLHEKGIIGSFLNGLFGYTAKPSLLELAAYVSYLGIIFWIYKSQSKRHSKLLS